MIPVYYAPSARRGLLETQRDRWWRAEEKDAGPAMVAQCQQLERDQARRFEEMRIFASLYSGKELLNLYQFTNAPRVDLPSIDILGHRVSFNVAQSCTDTASARLAKNKPRVLFLTSGGDWQQQKRAKQLTKYLDGLAYETDLYNSVSQPVFRDACIFPAGAASVFRDPFDGSIQTERVLPFEILIDDVEALYGTPATMHRRKYYPKSVLIEWLAKGKPELAAAIRDASPRDPTERSGTGHYSDVIAVYEGWHLPTGNANDGRHALGIAGTTLLLEPWTFPWFPIVPFRWNDLPVGWWGQCLVEQIVGIHVEISNILRVIQRGLHRQAVPRWLVHVGAKVIKSHIDNDPDVSIIDWAGEHPPTPVAAPVFSPEVYNWVQVLYQKAFEITGISMLSAAAKKPEGLNAGVALREYHDIESERFVVQGQRFEAFHLELARRQIELSRQAYEGNRNLRVRAPGTKLLEEIRWADVKLREDEYVMRPFPTSILPTTPAGRLQRVQELVDAQLIPRELALQLLDMPDLENAVSIQAAGVTDLERLLSNILDRGEYEPPDRHSNLALGLQLAHSAYLQAKARGAPEKRLELLARWLDEAGELLAQSTTPSPPALLAAAGPAAAAAGPAAAGTPALPSDLPA